MWWGLRRERVGQKWVREGEMEGAGEQVCGLRCQHDRSPDLRCTAWGQGCILPGHTTKISRGVGGEAIPETPNPKLQTPNPKP
jgi:hypothetical protein